MYCIYIYIYIYLSIYIDSLIQLAVGALAVSCAFQITRRPWPHHRSDLMCNISSTLPQPAASCQRSPRLNTGAGNKQQEQRNTHQNTEPSNSTTNHRPQKQTAKYCGIAVPSSAGPHALTPALWRSAMGSHLVLVLVTWSTGHLVYWSTGHLVNRSPSHG